MKIIKFTAENIKRLKAVSIDPKGNIIEITGPNSSGKTSVLDAIFWTLAGTKGMQRQPVRHGASEGHTEIELDDLIVRRKFSQTGSTLTVEQKAGNLRLNKPQEVLDKLLGTIGFDPLAFSRMNPKQQFAELRKLVKIDVDVDLLDQQNASDYQKRTDLNRDVKSMKGQLDGIAVVGGLPAAKIDIAELSKQVEDAATHNKEREAEAARRIDIKRDIGRHRENAKADHDRAGQIKKQIDDLTQQIVKLMKSAEDREKAAADLESELGRKQPIPDRVEVADVRKKIDEAISTNSAIDRMAQRLELSKKLDDTIARVQEFTDSMETREQTKKRAIAAAKFPVDGLGFGADEVLLNGVPFEQGSSAEQLRASCAIAMAMNPKLRVILIRDGSLLDDASMKILDALAKENDFQVWIEMVDESGTVGVVMSEGTVAADNQPLPQAG